MLRKFKNEALEARKIFELYGKLGSNIDIFDLFSKISLNFFEEPMPIPCKILGVQDAYEKNFDWIVPENLFKKTSRPKSSEKGTSKTTIDSIQCIVDKTFSVDSDSIFENT